MATGSLALVGSGCAAGTATPPTTNPPPATASTTVAAPPTTSPTAEQLAATAHAAYRVAVERGDGSGAVDQISDRVLPYFDAVRLLARSGRSHDFDAAPLVMATDAMALRLRLDGTRLAIEEPARFLAAAIEAGFDPIDQPTFESQRWYYRSHLEIAGTDGNGRGSSYALWNENGRWRLDPSPGYRSRSRALRVDAVDRFGLSEDAGNWAIVRALASAAGATSVDGVFPAPEGVWAQLATPTWDGFVAAYRAASWAAAIEIIDPFALSFPTYLATVGTPDDFQLATPGEALLAILIRAELGAGAASATQEQLLEAGTRHRALVPASLESAASFGWRMDLTGTVLYGTQDGQPIVQLSLREGRWRATGAILYQTPAQVAEVDPSAAPLDQAMEAAVRLTGLTLDETILEPPG